MENGMKKLILMFALLSPLMLVHAQTTQQAKMATCNKDAAGKKGDERKAFMKECLSAKPVATEQKGTTQQEKMKTCNASAKGMKGTERKQFMSQCPRNNSTTQYQNRVQQNAVVMSLRSAANFKMTKTCSTVQIAWTVFSILQRGRT
jgi:hypothetical protein